jgi:hypothetical protein
MLKEAIEYIVNLGKVTSLEHDGATYVNSGFAPLGKGEQAKPICVETLSGLIALMEARVESLDAAQIIVVVESFLQAAVVSRVSNAYGDRQRFAVATHSPQQPLVFGSFYAPEQFVIALQTGFQPTEDLAHVLSIASNLTAERITTAEDDGISQKVGVRKGIVMKEIRVIKARVNLAPFRTFLDIEEQPASDFLFRLREAGDEKPPQCALFEADGGAWKNQAMKEIAGFIEVELATTKGFEEVPVVW